jgi:hypothetical protein
LLEDSPGRKIEAQDLLSAGDEWYWVDLSLMRKRPRRFRSRVMPPACTIHAKLS